MTSSVTVASFSPSSIANCVQWLDATDIGTLFQNSAGTTPVTAAGQSVAFWRDKSGSNNSVFQFSTIPVPTYSNVLIGNQPGLDFTNSSHLRSANFQNSSNITAYVVGMVKNTIQGWGVFWGHHTTSDHDNYISFRNTSGQAVINWHTANDNSVMQMNYVLDSPVIYYGIMSNRFNTFFSQTTTQGTATVSGNVGGTILSASIPTFVGQSELQTEAIRSYISEIIYYQRVLTTFEQQQVQAYLAWKYNLQTFLPTTNPYRITPFLAITETIPRNIPANSFLLPINTYSTLKTFNLPVVSTNPGRLLILKDLLGYAGANIIRLSTLGLDRIERSNVSSMTLSNAYGAWTFTNDGRTNWFVTNVYANTFSIMTPIPVITYSNFLWTQFRNMTSSSPSVAAGGAGWGNAIGTAGAYNPINFQDGDSRAGQSDFVGIVCKGYFYSSSNTTVQFRMIIDDGGVVFYNNVNVLQSWILQGDTTYTSGSLSVTAGYTPFQFNFFEWGGGMTCELYYSIAGGAYQSDGTGRFFHDATSKTYP
jgi:hypothetical protein